MCNVEVCLRRQRSVSSVLLSGRGRALDAKSILMATDQNVVKAHEQNIIREQLMEDALNYVDAQPPQWLQLKVKVKETALRERFLRLKQRSRPCVKSAYWLKR